eukprot:276022-Prorocentrum_minimum.AAC.3
MLNCSYAQRIIPDDSIQPHSKCTNLHDKGLLQKVGDGVRGLGTVAEPLLNRGSVQLGLLLHGIIETEVLEGAAVTPVLAVNGDQPEEGALVATTAAEANAHLRLSCLTGLGAGLDALGTEAVCGGQAEAHRACGCHEGRAEGGGHCYGF